VAVPVRKQVERDQHDEGPPVREGQWVYAAYALSDLSPVLLRAVMNGTCLRRHVDRSKRRWRQGGAQSDDE